MNISLSMSYTEHLTAGLATIWDCTNAEASERIAPKRKRISQDSLREEIPWTTARCNRLLRTITSRINILRKQSKLCAAGPSTRDARPCRNLSRRSSEETSPPPKEYKKPSASDPEWVPGASTKTSSRTYGGRSKSRQKPASQKADSGFSTPFVKRLLKDAPASIAKPWANATGSDQHSKKVRQLPVQLKSSNEEAQRNLVKAFDGLLVTTSSASSAQRVGARSLMGACLRRVPDYIDLEVEDLDDDNEDDEDITSTIYNELENLGTNSMGGWYGLREVVRSHGLHHVRTAIDEGLVHDARISELVDACSKHSALLEADSLLQTWISRDRSRSLGRLEDSHIALTRLSELRSVYSAPEIYLRHHTDLLTAGHVYLSDVLRPGTVPLKDMISGLVRGPRQDIALAYLEAAVVEDRAASAGTSLPVFTRLAGLLSSLALVQATNANAPTPELDLFTIVNRVATTIMQHQDDNIEASADRNHPRHDIRVHPFVMASTLLQLTSQPNTSTTITTPLNGLIDAVATHQNAFVKFTVNVTHHVRRFSDADELESLLVAISGLLDPPPECSLEHRSTLNRLAFEVAFAYREQTGIEIDDHFTSKLAATHGAPTENMTQTPRRRVQVSGYKWEEGLCEWVAATPLAKPLPMGPQSHMKHQTPARQLPTPSKDDSPQSETESPFVLPSSPDIIMTIQAPAQTDTAAHRARPTRSALQECSANQRVQKLAQSPQQKKVTGFLKPALPKQVHLKEERAKKAALLAQSTLQAPPQGHVRVKRSLSLVHTSKADGNARCRIAEVDTDELGMLTPARKRSKRARGGRPSSSRTSLPARTLDVMSDDELGL